MNQTTRKIRITRREILSVLGLKEVICLFPFLAQRVSCRRKSTVLVGASLSCAYPSGAHPARFAVSRCPAVLSNSVTVTVYRIDQLVHLSVSRCVEALKALEYQQPCYT